MLMKHSFFIGLPRLARALMAVASAVVISTATWLMPAMACAATHFQPSPIAMQIMQGHTATAQRLGSAGSDITNRPVLRYANTGLYIA